MNNTVSFDYSGSRVLVTGGSSGIGHGIARAFAAAGARVVVTGTRERAGDYGDVDLSGLEYRTLQMRDLEAIKALARQLDGLDILINNAGASLTAGDEWTHEGFSAAVELNLVSGYHMARACLDHLTQSQLPGGASVIGIASLASFFANDMVPGYGAAKAGVVQLAKSLGLSWAKHGIRANAVAPGMVATRMTRHMQDMPEYNDAIVARTPLQRWGVPDDVNGAVLFLCSAQAAFITGQTLIVDGGYTLSV